jgi:hypothetical protein
VAGIEPLGVTEDDLEHRPWSDIVDRVGESGARLAQAGADVILPAEGVLNALLVAQDVREISGLPVVDGLRPLLREAAASVEATPSPAGGRLLTPAQRRRLELAAGSTLLDESELSTVDCPM